MNHALDYGAEGTRDTVRALDAAGVRNAAFGETSPRRLPRKAALPAEPWRWSAVFRVWPGEARPAVFTRA
ncbi:hypothetical protein FHX82_003325 [Amycolatopsis bartoniae]|nr:CapA family protein [Amycolatopsis bartoniae]MBB2936271.1 hypothetical protein [Amycolatopsis bartoniae]TVT11570.1 hypothetical protein FNH07_01780 [Amycolatopsis bartoniae]